MLRSVSDVTHILEAMQRGESRAAEELLPLVYDKLRRIAAYKMAQESRGHTLQPTALVHEAWLACAAWPGQFSLGERGDGDSRADGIGPCTALPPTDGLDHQPQSVSALGKLMSVK
jgi:hypothetical protein